MYTIYAIHERTCYGIFATKDEAQYRMENEWDEDRRFFGEDKCNGFVRDGFATLWELETQKDISSYGILELKNVEK